MGEILNELAFETAVDLEGARRALAGLWAGLTSGEPARASSEPSDPAAAELAGDVRSALERFDRARAAGGDLEALFRTLEADLGLDASGVDVADEELEAPDFPGVVGAVIEEFLWDLERSEGPQEAAACAGLRRLSAYAERIGLLEDLGRRELLDFAGRSLLDESRLASGEEARRLLAALERFCRWCQEHHGIPLWSGFADLHRGLADSLPRLAELRRVGRLRDSEEALPCRIVGVSGTRVDVEDAGGARRTIALREALAERLRPGDLLRIRSGRGRDELCACYPPELAELRKADA